MELSEVKRAMILGAVVQYDGIKYKVNSCILKYNRADSSWYYLLDLKDLKANSILTVPMKNVTVLSKPSEITLI